MLLWCLAGAIALYALLWWMIGPLATDWRQPIRAGAMIARLTAGNGHVVFGDSRTARAGDLGSGTSVFGFGGRRVRDFGQLAGEVCTLRPVRSITFAVGVNDALRTEPQHDVEADYLRLFESCSSSKMRVLEPWPIAPGATSARYDPVALNRVRTAARRAAAAAGATFVPAPASVVGLTEDGVHFNAAGRQRYAEVLAAD